MTSPPTVEHDDEELACSEAFDVQLANSGSLKPISNE